MNFPRLDRIAINSEVMGGKPCIRGIRITVGTIIGLLATGSTVEEILELHPDLEREDIYSALAYAERHIEESGIHSEAADLRKLITGMRDAYRRGENVTEFARRETGADTNSTIATLIAYDLQAGSYVSDVRANPTRKKRLSHQLASVLESFVSPQGSILEVGCGEATTLACVLQQLSNRPRHALGFDISWSRCAEGLRWLAENQVQARLFVADLFEIPLEDASIDVVYTSHSIEPNGGREEAAIRELLRVARQAVVLFEPIYELANREAQLRMRQHGYVRGLKDTAERIGAKVSEYRLLEFTGNPLNPSGLILLEKGSSDTVGVGKFNWRCPLTHTPLSDAGDVFLSNDSGLAYPVLRGIPLLRSEHGVVASGLVGKVG